MDLLPPSQNPILTGREPDASDAQRALSAERSAELSEKVNQVRCPEDSSARLLHIRMLTLYWF
jgi:hypothetical protein